MGIIAPPFANPPQIPPIQVQIPPIQLPPELQQGLEGIQQGLEGIQRIPGQIQEGINGLLTPDPNAWQGWDQAWADLGKRFSELFTDVTYQGQNNAAGIGKIGLPSLVIAGVIGAIGLGLIENMNSGLAFGIASLILVGLFLIGNTGNTVSVAVEHIRTLLGYPKIIPHVGE